MTNYTLHSAMPGASAIPAGGAWRYLGAAAFAAVLLGLPFLASSYQVFQLTMVVIYAIALLGLNILTGYNGQISIGHGAFYAVGAYVAAIMMDVWTVPYWLTLPAAGAVCLVVGFLFGLPALRLAGLYLALATFALGVALPQLLKFKKFEAWTGGVHGIVLNKPEAPFGLPLNADQWLYFFSLLVAVLMFVLGWNLLRGRVGRALMAIRDHPIAAVSMGVNTSLYKSLAFGVSAMFTGVAGALGAIAAQFVSPESFTIFLSISFLVGVVVGGVATLSGAIYGALFIQFVPNVADSISEGAPWAIYGVMLIVFAYLAPHGIAGALQRARQRLASRQPARD
ncbi:branched-chain amino acid ABC transporter permease [Aquincola sp. MAHUQ-54]|uniref:Branched-chain amino acid ABC transporter permease n=1 Tax=Aquincola agrisoli TaxID=3119538 RepID=A0AAW9QL87_9BURK